ncbi:HAD family hydrolase [bacterium]|nr:HAD family hydrolase [bacterium]
MKNSNGFNLNKFQHIIWDWNGTLLDDVELCVSIINTLLVKRKLAPVSVEYYREIFSFPIIQYYENLGFDFTHESFESIGTEFILDYEKKRAQCTLITDATTTLQYFTQLGLSQSILSASKQNYLLDAVRSYGLESLFMEINGLDNHYASSKVDIGLAFMARNNLDPKTILLIGDTLHDADVAKALGIECCLVPNGHQSQARLAACGVPIVNSLSELCQ